MGLAPTRSFLTFMPNRSIRTALLLAAVSWAILIFYLSSKPSIDAPMLFPGQDKLFHLVAFGILGFLVMGTLQASQNGYRQQQLWGVALAVMLYGISDEFHQYFVPGRSVDVYDVLADALGGLLGAWMMFQLSRISCKRSIQ
jgi:VanZ family protein